MKNYNATEIQKLFDERGLSYFKVKNVTTSVTDDCVYISLVIKERLCEHVKNHGFKSLIFRNNRELYKLTRFYSNVGGEKSGITKSRIMPIYVLEKRDKIIDVLSFHEFQNDELFANPNLTLAIDEIIEED